MICRLHIHYPPNRFQNCKSCQNSKAKKAENGPIKHKAASKIIVEHRVRNAELDIAVLSSDRVLERLKSGMQGLSSDEVLSRLQRHGHNTIAVEVQLPFLTLIRENFFHTMAVLLWCTGWIALIAQTPQLAIAIWMVNLINGTFSLFQEYRAEKATEALKKLLPTTVQVIRDGLSVTVSSLDLVPGDLILVGEGDKISADARLVSAEALRMDQSTLTGESHPVAKNSAPYVESRADHVCTRSEISNILFAGTSVLTGHGKAVVYATGTSTEFGRIAQLTQTIAEQASPLQKEMKRVTQIVTTLALSIGAVVFIAATFVLHSASLQSFILAMGIVVAFVPEGMVPTVTLALALAVQRMAKRNALVKRLSSVEALGCTNVICSDKTGTLTTNQMTVIGALAAGREYSFSGFGYSCDGSLIFNGLKMDKAPPELLELMRAGLLCNNARLNGGKNGGQSLGDPTELAILVAASKSGLALEEESLLHPRVFEIPFDSHRKRMTTVHESEPKQFAYVKGSPAVILENSNTYLSSGAVQVLDELEKQKLSEKIDSYARQGLRVIAAARKEISGSTFKEAYTDLAESSDLMAELESGLCFLGFFAMYDPPHPEVPAAIEKCHAAGIQVVMITGDYEVTAEAVARRVGIIRREKATVVTGSQLERMSDQELTELLREDIIFARVNPEHKLRVVQSFQSRGKIVAVTGDGVNDAPALKKADIGVAMGLAGTDVARDAADMILLDDNFASIVNAVYEGRVVYENIKKFAVYVFNSNMAEAVPIIAMILSCGFIPMPLTIMQMLAIDLGTDMLPAIGLGADDCEEEIMQRPPRQLSKPLLSLPLLSKALLWYGAIESLAGLSGYFYLNYRHGWPGHALASINTPVWHAASSMTLACIVASQVGAVFCCRTQSKSILKLNPFANRVIVAGVIFELLLLA
ncbi:MAG: cation-transporting P-type ATPase, partial [Candidatus Obscuribacterales bacterium]|nr:cation-transporting P-type ATPase [Candidatus Obscuribacterales bacterium]